jgi:hypothetical protein
MPTAIVTVSMMVALDVPEEYAAEITRADLVAMAVAACETKDGIQVSVNNVCQEKDGEPVFADLFFEDNTRPDPEIEFESDEFKTAIAERRGRHLAGS